jgi:hypothetical protein
MRQKKRPAPLLLRGFLFVFLLLLSVDSLLALLLSLSPLCLSLCCYLAIW